MKKSKIVKNTAGLKNAKEIAKKSYQLVKLESKRINMKIPRYEEVEERVKRDINNKTKKYLIYEKNGKIMGILLAENYKKYIKISDAYVVPKERNKGVMSKMLRKIEKIAKKRKKEIRLTVVVKNIDAIRFWKKRGFEIYKIKNILVYMKKCRLNRSFVKRTKE